METRSSEENSEKKKFNLLEAFILFLKGIVMGIANVIPGVSGGTIAVITGIFDRLIEAVNTLFKKFKENLMFLIPLGLGLLAGIVGLSKVMGFFLGDYPVQTNFFFVGLVIGSIPLIFNKTKESGKIKAYHIIPFVIAAGAVIALAIVQTYVLPADAAEVQGTVPDMSAGNFFKFLFGGILASAAMVVPGISGSLVMVLIGLYDKIIAAINGLTSFGDKELMLKSLMTVIPMGIGVVIGIFTVAKLIEFLLKKFKTATYVGILGLIIGSLIALLISMQLGSVSIGIGAIIVSALTCIGGFFLAFFLGR